jgi:hypothetical protein
MRLRVMKQRVFAGVPVFVSVLFDYRWLVLTAGRAMAGGDVCADEDEKNMSR